MVKGRLAFVVDWIVGGADWERSVARLVVLKKITDNREKGKLKERRGKIMKKRTKVENKRKVCRMKLSVCITKELYMKTFPLKGLPFLMVVLNEEE